MNEFKKLARVLLIVVVFTVALSIIGCKKECKHDYSESVFAPTCLADGYTEHTCKKCGDSYRDANTEKTGHNYVEQIIAPTCSVEGYTKHTCSGCHNKFNDSFTPVTAHRFNGGNCVNCSKKEITENIKADTEWYSADSVIFTINTEEQLAGLAYLVNSGTNFANQKIYLDADLDLKYYEWIPIGNAEHPFAGTFAGEGHTISNLKIEATSDCIGLFGNVSGSISDFTVRNASVYAKNDQTHVSIACGYSKNAISGVNVIGGYLDAVKSNGVGAVAGETEAQVDNCSNSAEVNGNDYVGGIVGSSNVASAVYTKLTNSGNVSGNQCVGGIVGHVNGSGSVQTDILSNTGNVTGAYQIGGIVGYINGKVGSTVYGASVSANIKGDYYVGGIVGKANNVAVSTCTNEGTTVTANLYLTEGENFYAYLGGFVGAGYSVNNCINNNDITYNSRGSYVGGIAGYLVSGASNCENNGNITGYNDVGGVAGIILNNTTSALTISSLKNSGNIFGNIRVGGIIGQIWSAANTTLSQLENTGTINATADGAGGITSCCNINNATLTAANLVNTGDVTAVEFNAGGLIGYVAGSTSSVIKNSSSNAKITGKNRVGGLVGQTGTVTIKDCSNEGSTVTATGWLTEGSTDYVWLGGCVGLGYKIIGCTNNSDITYDGTGIYVGGIVGFATNDISDCTNNGNITTKTNCVGGIAGEVNSPEGRTLKNLTNIGNISGNSRVGGIFGCLYQQSTLQGTWYMNSAASCSEGCCNHYYRTITNLINVFNSGSVTFIESNGAGIIGYAYYNSSYQKDNGRHCCTSLWMAHDGDKCMTYGNFGINSNDLKNIGSITGSGNIGEMFGYIESDAPSTLTNYTVIGSITINGELKEGIYDVGSKSNLTISNGIIYVPETTEGN